MVGLSSSPFKKRIDKKLIKKSKKIKVLVATQCLINSHMRLEIGFFRFC